MQLCEKGSTSESQRRDQYETDKDGARALVSLLLSSLTSLSSSAILLRSAGMAMQLPPLLLLFASALSSEAVSSHAFLSREVM